jgi:putative transposase
VIYHSRQKYTLKAMYRFFGVSRAASYAWVCQLGQADPDEDHLWLVHEAYNASHQTYGYRRIRIWLQRYRQVYLNHKTVLRLMRTLGFRSIARRRKPYGSNADVTVQQHYPNLLQRDFVATRPTFERNKGGHISRR